MNFFEQGMTGWFRLSFFGLAAALMVSGSDLSAQDDRPLDVARSAIGSTLFAVSEAEPDDDDRFPAMDTSDSQYLISDDEVLSTVGSEGTSIYLLTIQGRHMIDSFSFFNYFGSGTVTLEGLKEPLINKAQEWVPLSGPVEFAGTAPVHIVFEQPQVLRAIRITMNVREEGEFSGFGVSGIFTPDQLDKIEVIEVPEDTTLNSVITPSQVSRIIGVTPAGPADDRPDPERMVDDLVETTYTFETSDHVPAVLMDLGRAKNIERVTALVTTDTPARMEVYMISDVEDARPAEEEDVSPTEDAVAGQDFPALEWPMEPALASTGAFPVSALFPALASLRIQELIYTSPDDLQDLDPVAVAECPVDDPRIEIELEATYTTRFILIRWIPLEEGTSLSEFIVHEINLLGRYQWYFDDIAPGQGPNGELNTPPGFTFEDPPPASP